MAGMGDRAAQERRAEVMRRTMMGLEGYKEGREWLTAPPRALRAGEYLPPRRNLLEGGRWAGERLANEPHVDASRGRLERGAQARAGSADDKYVVIYSFVFAHLNLAPSTLTPSPSENPPIVPHAHCAEADVHIGEGDRYQTRPCPAHVPSVQTTGAVVRDLLATVLGNLILKAAHDVTE